MGGEKDLEKIGDAEMKEGNQIIWHERKYGIKWLSGKGESGERCKGRGAIKQSINEEAVAKPIVLYAIGVWGGVHGGVYIPALFVHVHARAHACMWRSVLGTFFSESSSLILDSLNVKLTNLGRLAS